MVKIKTWSKRIIMVILFTIALLITFQTVSGVKAETLPDHKYKYNYEKASDKKEIQIKCYILSSLSIYN